MPRRCRGGRGILRGVASSSADLPAGRQCRARVVELFQKPGHWRMTAVAFDDDGQRLGSEAAELAQQLEDGWRHVVQMVIEKPADATRSVDPTPATEMHGSDFIERHPAQQRAWFIAAVDGVGVKIVEVEQQLYAGPAYNARDPLSLAELARGRDDERGDVLDQRRATDNSRRVFEVPTGPLDRRLAAWRRRKMPNLNAA